MLEKYKNNIEREPKKKRIFVRMFLLLLIIVLFSALAFFAWWYLKNKKNNNVSVSEKTIGVETDKALESNSKDGNIDIKKISFGDNENENNSRGDEASSKNYRIKQIKFGGNIVLADGGMKDIPLKIYDVRSETVSSNEDSEPRFLITWKTNKEAISDIVYSKNSGSDVKKIAEVGYGFEHSALLKNIDFSTIYIYRVSSVDRWGNKVATEYFSAYTGEKSESIFDLIVNAVEDVFGWAMR